MQDKIKNKQNLISQKNYTSSNKLPQQQLSKPEQENYEDENFQSAAVEGSYEQSIDKKFTIDYENVTDEQIQDSASKMRELMKQISKKLDEKIHKYYGLMGIKHKRIQKNSQKIIKQLEHELEASKKLVETQISQIKQIEQSDKQMSSSKRIQKQAERLRQYFQTKKAMLQMEKQTKFCSGQVSKYGDYLAKDLDLDKYYFRLNKIKQDLEYAILKEGEMTKKDKNMQEKYIEMTEKSQILQVKFQGLLREAEAHGIVLSDNKESFKKYQQKKMMFDKKAELTKSIEVVKGNNQSFIYNIYLQVEGLKKIRQQKSIKIDKFENQIQDLLPQINSLTENNQKLGLKKKIQLSIPLKNIETLLKSKRQKSDSTLSQMKQSKSLQTSSFVKQKLSQSLVLMRPNFKIKSLASPRSKSKLSKSINPTQVHPIEGSTIQKRVLKWRRQKDQTKPALIPKQLDISIKIQENPQKLPNNQNITN